MKIIKVLTRLYVNDINNAKAYYEKLLKTNVGIEFKIQNMGLELAEVGDFLLIAGTEEALRPFRNTVVTILVDSVDEYKTYLESQGATILRGPSQVPTGRNMTVKHPDGIIMEYVEHSV